jgi:hypothetical protein
MAESKRLRGKVTVITGDTTGRRFDYEGKLCSGRRTEKKAEPEQNDFPLTLIVVIEQWICLVLGIVCVVSGILGISMNPRVTG